MVLVEPKRTWYDLRKRIEGAKKRI